MNNQNTREKIGEIIGEASMCWSETPTGIFQSDKAVTLMDKLEAIASQSRQQGRMEMAEEMVDAVTEEYGDESSHIHNISRENLSTIINNLKVK